MLTLPDPRLARQVKRRLRQLTPVNRLVVYGSRARGDATAASDLDLYIVVPDLTPELRQKISEIAWEVSLEYEVVITTLVASERQPFKPQPILRAIETEGIAV